METVLYRPVSDADGDVLEDCVDNDKSFNEANDLALWGGSKAYVGLILAGRSEPVIRFVALVRKGPKTGTNQARVTLRLIRPVEAPLPIAELRQALPRKFRHHLDRALSEGTPVAPKTNAELMAAVTRLRPDVASDIDRLLQAMTITPVSSPSIDRWRDERDAVGLALTMAGFKREALLDWDAPHDDAPFLAGVNGTTREDSLLGHDAKTFPGWMSDVERLDPTHVAAAHFVEPKTGRKLTIVNVNRTIVEENLGIDLLYYTNNPASFTLVQYKRFVKEGDQLIYRPGGDRAYQKELKHLREINTVAAAAKAGDEAHDNFRLYASPCWVKICNPVAFVPSDDSLVPGMYLPLPFFEQLCDGKTLVGQGGAVGVTYERTPRWFTNSTFTSLVGSAWCGSVGPTTDMLTKAVRASLNGERSVVIAVVEDPAAVSTRAAARKA